jgi:hypothetical protein
MLAGLYRATVANNLDPTGRKRLLVIVAGSGSELPIWSEACVPYRSRALPPAGSTVWLQFDGGDPSKPVWLGIRP